MAVLVTLLCWVTPEAEAAPWQPQDPGVRDSGLAEEGPGRAGSARAVCPEQQGRVSGGARPAWAQGFPSAVWGCELSVRSLPRQSSDSEVPGPVVPAGRGSRAEGPSGVTAPDPAPRTNPGAAPAKGIPVWQRYPATLIAETAAALS